jgi:23S rRNA (pseudouridine1915-N3)-methyltransferase
MLPVSSVTVQLIPPVAFVSFVEQPSRETLFGISAKQMAEITIVSCSREKQSSFRPVEEQYCKQLSTWVKVSLVNLAPKQRSSKTVEELKAEESKIFLNWLDSRSYLVLLDLSGRSFDSLTFSSWLNRTVELPSKTVFAVGGPWGWHSTVLARTDAAVRLSELTFSGELARLVLLEQIYRAFTIIKGRSYHK